MMATETRKRGLSNISTRPDHSNEDFVISGENLEMLLEEDRTFVEFFNAFLALPMFPIRLFYNPDMAYFEEFKQQLADNFMDNDAKKATALQRYSFFKNTIDNKGLKIGYYVKFLSKEDGFDWVKKNRLPLFVKSELCAEYKLARILSFDQTVYLMNILVDSRNLEKNAFDERSSPQYRTHRTRGKLPGLAEFQERMQLLEGSEMQSIASSNSSDESDKSCSESDDVFSKIHLNRRNRNQAAFQEVKSFDDDDDDDDDNDADSKQSSSETIDDGLPLSRNAETISKADSPFVSESVVTDIYSRSTDSFLSEKQTPDTRNSRADDAATDKDNANDATTDSKQMNHTALAKHLVGIAVADNYRTENSATDDQGHQVKAKDTENQAANVVTGIFPVDAVSTGNLPADGTKTENVQVYNALTRHNADDTAATDKYQANFSVTDESDVYNALEQKYTVDTALSNDDQANNVATDSKHGKTAAVNRQSGSAVKDNDTENEVGTCSNLTGPADATNVPVNRDDNDEQGFDFNDSGILTVVGALKKTYKEAIGMPGEELSSVKTSFDEEKCQVCGTNKETKLPDKPRPADLNNNGTNEALNVIESNSLLTKRENDSGIIMKNYDEDNDKPSIGKVIQETRSDNQISGYSNVDKDIKECLTDSKNQLILINRVTGDGDRCKSNEKGEAETYSGRVSETMGEGVRKTDMDSQDISKQSRHETLLVADEKPDKTQNVVDAQYPSVTINVFDEERTETEFAAENKNKQDSDINKNNNERKISMNHLKHDSNSSFKSLTGRRGSDWSAMANENEIYDDDFPRRRSMPALKREALKRRLSSVSNASDAMEAINDLLADEMVDFKNRKSQAAISVLYEESDSDDDCDYDESGRIPKRPIDVASKSGMDAFKYFLVDTPGEKLFLLWVEIERLKYSSDKEKSRIIHEIRQRFFRSGSAYEINMETLKKWNIKNISEIGYQTLIDVQENVLEPLRVYWCARFTVHQKRKHKSLTNDYISQDHSCTKSKCSTHQIEMTRVPQRPNTCFPHFRVESANRSKQKVTQTTKKIPASESSGRLSIQSDILQPHSDTESGRTKARIRSKSAYPRLINTSNPKDINLSQKQLQMITTIDEGCGYSSIPNKSYRNDASTPDHKSNIRLFIQPIPPANCKASTIIKSSESSQEKHDDGSNILLDSLVECLLHEKHSGNFFYCYLEKANNQLWLNCYHFWQLLQDYSEHFFTDKFSPGLIKQKAGFLYSNFIVNGSKQSINCDMQMQKDVFKRLDPAYEELFDKAEEHALKILSEAFKLKFSEESNKYNELTKNEKLRYLDVRTKLKRPKYQPEEKEEEKDTEKEDYREKISIEEAHSPLPVSSDGVTFDSFIRNKVEVESFKEFLERANNKGLKDLLAWTEMENFRRSSQRHNQRNTIAKSVGENWLTKDYFFGPLSPATREAQDKIRNMAPDAEIPERPPSPVILEAQKYVRARIERRWFVMFKETNSYQQRHKTPNVAEMVEDMVMKRRLQRSEAAWKILNSRWVSGSRDVVALRQVLMDPIRCLQFRKFLSLKGELMERNVYFWLEVQKYKDLCHRHVEDSIIKNKIQAIIDVFIKSSIPPDLQIDIPIEIAERLHEKSCGRTPQHGPYLFREAQTTVFRIMFNHWKEFVTFRASIEDEKFDQHLEELDKKHKAQVRARKMIAERKRLAKAAFEKRRKEREEQEREKERQKILANAESLSSVAYENATSLISEDEEFTMQTKTFTFSKFTVEQELQALEQRMREEGCTLDEFTEGDFTQSYFTTDRKTNRKMSIHLSDDQRSVSGLSFRRGRRTSDIFSKVTRKESIVHEPIFESKEQLFNKRGSRANVEENSKNKTATLKITTTKTEAKQQHNKQINLNTTTEKTNLLSDKYLSRKRADDSISVGKMSSVTDLGKIACAQNVSLMPGPQRQNSNSGISLTTKSLREFNKTSQGKPLSGPLPLIHVTNSSSKDKIIETEEVIRPVSGNSKSTSSKKNKSHKPRFSRTYRTRLKNESANEDTTKGIVADIIVC